MEKINYTPHEHDWVDGLLAILDSARQLLLEMKHSRSVGRTQTLEEFARANGLESALISGRARPETIKGSRFSVHRIVNSPVKTCRWPLEIMPCIPYRARIAASIQGSALDSCCRSKAGTDDQLSIRVGR